MNEIISAALRENADNDVHIEQLLGAVHAGVRQRRQRRLALSCGVVVAIMSVSLGIVTSIRRPAVIAGPATDAALPRPPRVERVPTAATSPGVLGSDPTLFHLDLTDLSGWKHLVWATTPGQETVDATTESGAQLHIEAARDRARLSPADGATSAVTIDGTPAEALRSAGSQVVRWQPVPGIWAQVQVPGDVAAAVAVARRVRLDRVYRCAVPFQLTGVVSARLTKCTTYYSTDGNAYGWSSGGVWFTIGTGGPEYQVGVGPSDPSIAVNDTIQGRAVRVAPPANGNPALLEIDYPYDGRTAYFWVFYGPVDQAVFRSLIPAFAPAANENPQTWPSNPFH
jgi:hypothetical protein